MPVEALQKAETAAPVQTVAWFPLDEINEPGAYVTRNTGDLVRVLQGHRGSDAAELISQHQEEPILVTQISKDPFVPISRARLAAANADIEIKF